MPRPTFSVRAGIVVALSSVVLAYQAPQLRAGQAAAVRLFADARPLDGPQLASVTAQPRDASVVRSRLVTIDLPQLFVADASTGAASGRGPLLLNLFDDVAYNATFDRLDLFDRGQV